MSEPSGPMCHRLFIERLIIALLVLGLAILLWQLRGLLILVFGAILFAVILRTIANPIQRRLRLPDAVALLIAVIIVFGILALAILLFGAEIYRQAGVLREAIPAALKTIEERLSAMGLGEAVGQWTQQIQSNGEGVLTNLGGIIISLGSALTDLILLIAGGIFLAARPQLYRRGVIKLVPEEGRGRAAQALDDSWHALRLWLLGRLMAMVLVGLLIGLGLWLIGVPAVLTLSLVAALLEFVPFIGPIFASVPAVLLALLIDPMTAVWVALLYLVVQQAEGNIITPVVQHHAVDLPPALLLFSLVAAGLVFGIIGILLAEPLTVVLFVLVKRLYVREALHTDTPIPGENRPKKN